MRSYERYASAPARLLRVYDGPVASEGRHRVFSYGFGCLAMWWIRTGQLSLLSKGRKLTARTGQLVLVGIGESRQDFSEDSHILSINYTWNEEHGRPFYALQGVWIGHEGCEAILSASTALALIVARHFGNPSAHMSVQPVSAKHYFEIQTKFNGWLMELSAFMDCLEVPRSDQRSIDVRVERACGLLEAAPLDLTPNYNKIANDAGLSRAHLERLFRMEFHLSPHAAFERRRINFARTGLLEEAASIKEISLQLGFHHLSRFSNWFTQKEGLSPRRFRELRFRSIPS